MARFGRIDCLFNNAAGPTQEVPRTELDAEQLPGDMNRFDNPGQQHLHLKDTKRGVFGLEVVDVTDRGTAERNLGFKGAKTVELYV